MAHAGGLRQLANYAGVTGLELSPGLPAALIASLSAPDAPEFVPARQIIEGLEACAAASGRREFGAAFAAWADLSSYGPLSQLTGHCRSVRDALTQGLRYMHLTNGAVTSLIEDAGDQVVIRRLTVIGGLSSDVQFIESVQMTALRAMRVILGEGWTPLRVEFAHEAPADPAPLQRLFRAPLRFAADRNAIVLRPVDMARTIPVADPDRRARLDQRLRALDQVMPEDFLMTVRKAMARALASGAPRLDTVADSLGLHPRTTQRRLTAAGASFAKLLAEARIKIAQDYLRNTPRPRLDDLADRLQFADASATSRFLRHELGSGLRRKPQVLAALAK